MSPEQSKFQDQDVKDVQYEPDEVTLEHQICAHDVDREGEQVRDDHYARRKAPIDRGAHVGSIGRGDN